LSVRGTPRATPGLGLCGSRELERDDQANSKAAPGFRSAAPHLFPSARQITRTEKGGAFFRRRAATTRRFTGTLSRTIDTLAYDVDIKTSYSTRRKRCTELPSPSTTNS